MRRDKRGIGFTERKVISNKGGETNRIKRQTRRRVQEEFHVQSRSLLTLSIALALPFSFSFIRRMDSSIVLRSSPAFLALANVFCLRSLSSLCRDSSSSVGGTTSVGLVNRGERIDGGDSYVDSLDDIPALRSQETSCHLVKLLQ